MELWDMIRRLHGFLISIGIMIWIAGAVTLTNPVLAQSENKVQIPAEGMPTVLDLGATACIPCKMMAPILEKLEKEYRGKAAVIFVDVWKDNTEAKRFGIRTIPTQIFFDRSGTEFWRHEGFLDEETIVTVLNALLKKTSQSETIQLPPQSLAMAVAEPEKSSETSTYIIFLIVSGLMLLLITGWVLWELKKKRRIRASD